MTADGVIGISKVHAIDVSATSAKEDPPMIVLNDKDSSTIDESNILEMYGKLSGYDAVKAPELKYAIAVVYKGCPSEKVYFYAHWDNLVHDRQQIIEFLQARKLTPYAKV